MWQAVSKIANALQIFPIFPSRFRESPVSPPSVRADRQSSDLNFSPTIQVIKRFEKKNCSKTNNSNDSIWFQHISQQLPCKYSTVKKLMHCQNTSCVFKLQKPRYTWSYVAGRALPKSLAHHERSSSLCPESDDEFCFYLGKNHFNKHTKKSLVGTACPEHLGDLHW